MPAAKAAGEIRQYCFMKKENIILGLAAALSAAACSSVSETTVLGGSFSGADVPEEITIRIPDVLDTVVALENAAFKIEIPACKAVLGQIIAGQASAPFISDGTPLTVAFDGGRLSVTSGKPSVSDMEKLNAFSSEVSDLVAGYRAEMGAIRDSSGLSEAEKNSLMEAVDGAFEAKYKTFNVDVMESNKDNVISTLALRNIYYMLPDDSLELVCGALDTAVIEANPIVSSVLEGVLSRKGTAEGMKFKDFTATQPDGSDASLSDYVGKGKYVLVDFWASWCGPCKREIPNIKAVYDKFHGGDFDVLSVAVWDEPQASVDTAKAYGVKWNEIVNTKEAAGALYGIQSIPHIILFGPDGTILKRNLRGEDIEKEVAKYVKK